MLSRQRRLKTTKHWKTVRKVDWASITEGPWTNIMAAKINCIFRTRERIRHCRLYPWCTPGINRLAQSNGQSKLVIRWNQKLCIWEKDRKGDRRGQASEGDRRGSWEGRVTRMNCRYLRNCQKTNLVKEKEWYIVTVIGHSLLWCISREISIQKY